MRLRRNMTEKQKSRKPLRTMGRRMVCGLLSLSMVAQSGAGITMASAAQEKAPTYLKSSRITGDKLPEGDWLYFGTAAAAVAEHGEYAIRVFREGNLKKEASVELRTIDMTAIYGEDYELVGDDVEELEENSAGKTLLEMYAKGQEISHTDGDIAASLLLDTEQNSTEKALTEAAAAITAEDSTVSDTAANSTVSGAADGTAVDGTAAGTSSLAAKKEAQTGEATRELMETEDKGMMDAMAQQVLDDSTTEAMQNLTASSTSKLHFAKGESEKVVRFRILEDKESEGTEGFTLLLAEPEGAELYQVGTAGITIEDDEKKVRSEVSFTEKEYQAKDGKASFTVKRTGAEYSVCDMVLMTSEDTAKAGKNYTEKCETLSFAPYETEKTVEMDVSGAGKFSVLLTELKACTEGAYTKAVITIPQEEEGTDAAGTAAAGSTGKNVQDSKKSAGSAAKKGRNSGKGSVKKASDTEEQSFGITLNRKDYSVYYKMGDTYGRIMDEGYNPPIEVGRYFFPQDQKNGGMWTYYGYGAKPNSCGHWEFKYHCDENTPDTMVNNYGHLSYKHTTAGKTGGTGMKTFHERPLRDFGMAGVYYQYVSPDIQIKNDAYIDIVTDDPNGMSDGTAGNAWIAHDDYSRAQDVHVLKVYDPGWAGIRVETCDRDFTTAEREVKLYGIVAMYRKLNIKVQNPEKMTYRTGKDSTIQMEPTNMTVRCGAQPNPLTAGNATRDVYANPNADDTNFVFSPGSMSLNDRQGIYGYITGYDITIDNKTPDDRVNVTYPEDYITFLNSIRNTGADWMSIDTSWQAIDAVIKKTQENTTVVPYDAYFFQWLASLTKGHGYNYRESVVASDGLGWKHNLIFKPKMAYYDVKVSVLPSVMGEEIVTGAAHFTDESLKENHTYTFHAGDSIDLSIKSTDENKYFAVGYQVSTDDGVHWDTITSTEQLFLEYDKRYMVRPIVTTRNNCIEVRFRDEKAEECFEIQGLVPASELKDTDMEGKNILMINPDAKTVEEKVKPVVGETYTIRVVVKDGKEEDGQGRANRPMMAMAAEPYYRYNTQYMEMRASSSIMDNVVEISCSRVKKAMLNTYTIKGTVRNRQSPIRQSGSNKDMQYTPAVGNVVAIPKGTQSASVVNKNTGETIVNADTVSSETGDDGEYVLQGIIAAPGDRIPLYVYCNGEVQTIEFVDITTEPKHQLSTRGSSIYESSTFSKATTRDDSKMSDGQNLVDAGITTIYPSSTIPKVTMLDYDYEKAENRQKQGGNVDNTVHIYDDTFIMTAVVDPNGRKIKSAVFTVYHFGNAAKYEEYRVDEEPGNPNTFVCKIPKMAESFHNGDGVRIQLIDAQDSFLSVGEDVVLDDEGNPVQGQTVETVYPAQDSGLTFYIENELVYPQTFDVETSPTANVPLIGSATSNTTSGLLTFGKSWWDKDKTGYTLQIGVDALWSEMPSTTTSQKKDGYQNLHKTVRDATQMESMAKNMPNAEEVIMGLTDEDYFSHFTDDEFNESAEGYDSYNAQLTAEKAKMQDIVDTIKNDATSKAKKARASMTKEGAWSIDVALLLAFDFVYNPVEKEYVFSCGTVAAGGSFTYNKTMYTIISSVPAFLNFSATLQLNGLVSYTTSEGKAALSADDFSSYAGNLTERLSNPQTKFSIMISGKVQVGVGMCGVLAARGYASIKLQFDIPFNENTQGGVLLGATGGVGFDLLVISINIDIVNASYGTGSLASQTHVDFFGGLASIETKKAKKGAADTEAIADRILKKYSDSETLTAHTYSAGTSDMSSFGKTKNKKATLSAVSVTPLLENAAERTRPQIIPLDNGRKMMVFIANRASGKKDDYVLNYTLYDGTKWQTPVAVADDGTVDSTPDILRAGSKVIIAWADANRAFTDTDTNIDKLSAMDISVAVYDTETGVMGEKKTLVKDGFFDLAPQLAIDNENIYCSYMKRDLSKAESEADLTDFGKLYSTMAYATYDYKTGEMAAEKYISIKHENLTDPVVLDYQSVIMEENGDTYLVATYTVDEDKDLNTNEDRELFLSIYNVDKNRRYYPIRLSQDKINQSVPKLTDIDGVVYLTWLENGYIFKLADVSNLMDGLFNTAQQEFEVDVTDENGRNIKKNVTIDKSKYINGYMTDTNENREWYKKTAQELGMDSSVYENTVYESLTQNKIPTDGANFNQNEDIQESVGNYQLVSDGDDVYVFFTNAGKEQDSTGVEIYGVRYQRAINNAEEKSSMDGTSADDREATHWGFGKSVQLTHANKVIDELDLYMTKDSKVSAVSNYFDQWIDDAGKIQYSANQLVEIEFETKGSIEVKDSTVELPSSYVVGETQPIKFSVQNTGLLTSKGFDYTVSQVVNGRETVIESGHRDTTLFAAEEEQMSVMWKVPDNLTGMEIKITVKETGVDAAQTDVAIRKVPYGDNLVYGDTEILWNDNGPYVHTTIRNKGNAASKAYKGALCGLDDKSQVVKTFASFDVPALESGKETQIDIPFTPDVEDFNHLGIMELSLRVSDGDKLIMDKLTKLTSSVPVCAKIGDGKDITLKGDEAVTLKTTIAPWGEAYGTPQYSSSNPTVATVDENGKVTTNGNGVATLYAQYPMTGLTASVKVNVSGKKTDGDPDADTSGDNNSSSSGDNNGDNSGDNNGNTNGDNNGDTNGDSSKEGAATKKITLGKKSVVIAAGKSKTVKVKAAKAASAAKAAAVKAKTSNGKAVKAKVSGGRLKLTVPKKAAKGLTATVTLTSTNAKGKKVSAKIQVKVQNRAKSIRAARKALAVKKGKTVKLILNVKAENGKKPTTDTVKVRSGNVALTKTTAGKGKLVVTLRGKKKGTKKVVLQVGSRRVTVVVNVK